jgi:SAM-dependent methyltransferase
VSGPPPAHGALRRVRARAAASTGTGHAPSRHLHESLGFKYQCIDIDGNFGAIALDMNFDPLPAEYRGKFGMTTNHGTTEHIFNQLNAFKMIHDLTRPGGLMLHALPFTIHLEHGFFNYQPNLFDALARFNSYKTLGVWVGPDWTLSSLVPWEPSLLNYLRVAPDSSHLLVVLQQKTHDNEFCVPIQTVYEPMVPESALDRYQLVVDGEFYSGRRIREVTRGSQDFNLRQVPMVELAKHMYWRLRRRLLGGN